LDANRTRKLLAYNERDGSLVAADPHLDAAEYLMNDPELARMMPPSLKKRVRERQKVRRCSPWWLGGTGRAVAG
jgi:hypothetical protein